MCIKRMFANAVIKALYKDANNSSVKNVLANHSLGDVISKLLQNMEENKLEEFLKTLGFNPAKKRLFENFVVEKDNGDNLDTEVSLNIEYKKTQFHIGIFLNTNEFQLTIMPYDSESYIRFRNGEIERFGMVDNYSEILMRFMLPSSVFEKAAQFA